MKRDFKLKDLLTILFITTCFITFAVSLMYIISYLYSLEKERNGIKNLQRIKQQATEQKYNQLQEDTFVSGDIQAETTENDVEEEVEKEILDIYKELHEENSDLAGWIKIDDTIIDYPVMWTPTVPNYYEHKDWEGNDSISGLPLIDALCTLDGNNTIIYAHDMRNGTMFGSLLKYKEREYWEEHPMVKFDTIYEEGEYQILGVLLARVYYEGDPNNGDFLFYNYTNLSSEKEFNEYIMNVKAKSLYETGITAEYGDKLITLCTCHYHTRDGRLLVVAKKIA